MAGDRPYQRQSFWPMKDLLEPNQPLSPANDQLLGEIIKQPVLIDAIFIDLAYAFDSLCRLRMKFEKKRH